MRTLAKLCFTVDLNVVGVTKICLKKKSILIRLLKNNMGKVTSLWKIKIDMVHLNQIGIIASVCVCVCVCVCLCKTYVCV